MARKRTKSANAASNSFYRAARICFGVVAGGIFEVIVTLIPYTDSSGINYRITHDVAGAFLLLLLAGIATSVAGFFINFFRSTTPASTGLISLAFSIAAGIVGAIELRKAIPGLKLVFGSTKIKAQTTLLVGQIGLKPLLIVMVIALLAVGSISVASLGGESKDASLDLRADRPQRPAQRPR